MDSPIIILRNINKTLKKKKVLDDISISFIRNKIYGVVGANASGKTMLFRAICKLIKLDSGEVVYDPPITTFGVMIENPGFLLSYTGYENLKFLADIKGTIGKEQIVSTMRKVGLNPEDSRKVKAYSLGMKQKLAIAQAIMETPNVLVLDEPTRGLDDESITNIRSLLVTLKEEGTTILIASHNKEDISVLCDEVLYINNGKLMP